MCKQCKTDQYTIEDTANGNYVCTACGLVDSGTVFVSTPAFDGEMNTWSNYETHNVFSLNTQKPNQVKNVTFYTTQNQRDLKLLKFNKRFNECFHSLQLPEPVGECAKDLYLIYERKHSCKGRSMDCMVYAFIQLAAEKKSYGLNLEKYLGSCQARKVNRYAKMIQGFTQTQTQTPCQVEARFKDEEIESFVCQYATKIGMSRQEKYQVIKHITKAEFILRKKETIAIALLVKFKDGDKSILKILSAHTGIKEQSIELVMKELKY
jgi:transcription initiation factor TFIIIB Brf1 subunit/transcription initiation factor TFIIB